ncbi:unnamed protein product [Schistosoma margrebowiei]|uniref:Uncharacterized protein n=1 Tax=Schistosoma margrebowiei TaxID=48269 RepID=A0A183LUC8_9TREM|nr:unnamed protein product [Schistosoma margrebowiei]
MEDVRTRRGDFIAPHHHHLVVAKMKLKLKKQLTTGETELRRFSTAFPQHTDKLNEFKIDFNNRVQVLPDLLK